MCEFCEYGKRFSIADEDEQILDKDSKFELVDKPEFWIQESSKELKDNPTLISYVRFRAKNEYSQESIYTGLSINYCPICGRKLENYGN